MKYTVEFPLVDTPLMWTLLFHGHFSPARSAVGVYNSKCPQYRVSTTVDGSLMWTLSARPKGVHIRGTLLYFNIEISTGSLINKGLHHVVRISLGTPVGFPYIIVWWMTSKNPPKTTHSNGVTIGSGYIKIFTFSGKIVAGDQTNFSLYTIPNFHPKNGDVCRGSQRKVRKWASSTRLLRLHDTYEASNTEAPSMIPSKFLLLDRLSVQAPCVLPPNPIYGVILHFQRTHKSPPSSSPIKKNWLLIAYYLAATQCYRSQY